MEIDGWMIGQQVIVLKLELDKIERYAANVKYKR